jgi:lycopene cyclase domain-containing protein
VDHWQYLILLAACLVVTAPLEFLGTGVYRWPRRLAYAVLPVAAVFLAWDAVAIAAGVWRYNPTYLTGWQVPGHIPVEEVAFFLVIPVCGLLTYTAVDRILARAGGRRGASR